MRCGSRDGVVVGVDDWRVARAGVAERWRTVLVGTGVSCGSSSSVKVMVVVPSSSLVSLVESVVSLRATSRTSPAGVRGVATMVSRAITATGSVGTRASVAVMSGMVLPGMVGCVGAEGCCVRWAVRREPRSPRTLTSARRARSSLAR